MKLFNKILIIILLPVFVFSSTGIVLVNHTCETCGVSELLINKQHTHKEDHCVKTENSCCKASSCEMSEPEAKNSECCKEDHFYFKVKEPFVSGANTVDIEIKVLELVDNITFEKFELQLTNQIYKSSIIKPPDKSGREILRNNCVLIV